MKRYIAEEFTGGAWAPLVSRLTGEAIGFDDADTAEICADLFETDAVRIIDREHGVEICRRERDPSRGRFASMYRAGVRPYDPDGRDVRWYGRGVLL